MTRYLVLEVTDQTHDLADRLEDMRVNATTEGEATLVAAGLMVNVRIPDKALVKRWATINGPKQHLYVEE
jgi:hypothetical protein